MRSRDSASSRRSRSSRAFHPDLEALLDHRDGRGTSATARHLESCEPCRDRLEETFQIKSQLRALTSLAPPRDRWSHIQSAITADRATARRRFLGRLTLMAASLALVISGAAWVVDRQASLQEQRALETRLAELRERSQLLDAELRNLQLRSMPTWRAELLLPLEDDLIELDGELDALSDQTLPASNLGGASAAELIELWQDRLALQDTMLLVHDVQSLIETDEQQARGSL